MKRSDCVAALGFVLAIQIASTARTEPYVLPTQAQEFALKMGLDESLGIEWDDASPHDIATYVNAVTAIDVVAQRIAESNSREAPNTEDYELAAAAWCKLQLPNKPQDIAEFSDVFQGSYPSDERRSSIANAVGPVLLEGSFKGFEIFLANERPGMEAYQADVLDFSKVR